MSNNENPNASAADDEDYEEPGGWNYFVGFMFGNVDDSGDLDADYLDEDVKEHIFALADELGLSLQDIDLARSSPAPTDSSEQDCDEKAEDTVDFEDIDEEYDGLEVEAPTEEDNVLSRKDYFSSNAVYTSVDSTLSVFGEDNYDEDEGTINDIDSQVNSAVQNCSSDGIQPYPQVNLAKENVGLLPHSEECLDFDYELLQREMGTEEGYLGSETAASLPVLCIEDVELSNILEKVVDCLRRNTAVSYIFLKPVTKKDAPDYLDIIDHPMDLVTIRDKVRKMEYRNRKGFRHDVAQIAVNAHIYNDNRNPGIPPLADELLKMCDQLLEENAEMLDDAEAAIE
ncbi:transcription initiation factor TFIID subunit 1-like [Miscanthus floridulus]|uniref:transcription initiation factor TFIID subunit 1-like n=1 Tax=Miscanthus floridulus TaxID=154761 RepID=UPI00345A6B63